MFVIGFCIIMGAISLILIIGCEWKYWKLKSTPQLMATIESKVISSNGEDAVTYIYKVRLKNNPEKLIQLQSATTSRLGEVGEELAVVRDAAYDQYYPFNNLWYMHLGALMGLMGVGICGTILFLYLKYPQDGTIF